MPNFVVATGFTAIDKGLTSFFKKAGVNVDKFGTGATRSFNKASRAGSRFGDIVKGVLTANVLAKAPSAIKSIFTAFIGEAAKTENAIANFKTLTGSMKTAEQTVNKLQKTAAATPFEFGTLADATKTLLGFEAATTDNLIPTLKKLGDTAGGSADKFKSIVLAFSQIQAGGKASMQDINQLINAGVPILGQLSKQWGVTVGQARAMISTGKATGKEVGKAFDIMTGKGGKFFKGMETASLTLTGRFSTFTDNIKLSAAAIGTALLPFLKKLVDKGIKIATVIKAWAVANKDAIGSGIQAFIDALSAGFETMLPFIKGAWSIFKGLFKVLKFIAPIIPVLVAGMIAYNLALKVQIALNFVKHMMAVGQAIRAAGGAQILLTAAMAANPIGAIILAVGALVVLFIIVKKNWDKIKIALIGGLKFILQMVSKLIGFLGFDTSGIDAAVTKLTKAQEKIRDKGLAGGIGGANAPNKESAKAANIRFQGALEISGAPKGSKIKSKTEGAPPVRTELLGQN